MKILLGLLLLAAYSTVVAQTPSLVPMPDSMIQSAGPGMRLPEQWVVSAPAAWQPHLTIVGEHIGRLAIGETAEPTLRFVDNDGIPNWVVRQSDSMLPEQYSLDIGPDGILLQAGSLRGLAHGTASLLQILGQVDGQRLSLVKIEDGSKVPYRNLMIDMGRNPHSLQLLKETVDLLWFYKIDSLQLHLTDDQRFAWPSRAFPKLWDGKISLAQFRELEQYAVDRGVTLIPELEVPGHSGLLRSAYPEVFGKSPTELATSESALQGIQTLLDELMDVFASSPYIHVGVTKPTESLRTPNENLSTSCMNT